MNEKEDGGEYNTTLNEETNHQKTGNYKPPVSRVKITAKAIDIGSVIRFVSDKGSGATVLFLGTVRNRSEAGKVKIMEYEAYEKMAVKEIMKMIRDATGRWQVCRVAVIHRIGKVKLKEPSVAVAVSSPHRRDAFSACMYIIDSIKTQAPIWKKEILEGGREVWMQGAEISK
jgi:molybdopterin synthase catalytic subunit